MAARDALSEAKTRMAEALALELSKISDKTRRFPPLIREMFEKISSDFHLEQLHKEAS
ncbi:hypothetical protein [Candidatus Magnetaquicoccus inordinatus]|uniref:hypothetical protein n=1 Tax=Candidatus Magnetaquicoccus inordinatus TaxID=2496818 RepID=UPI00187D6466|nr:hypothetical protein [Candidatus Magnetaquicoccus inordinatus]